MTNLTQLNIFPVKIFTKVLLDSESNRLEIIDECYRLRDKNNNGIKRSNFGGWHSENNLIQNKVFDKLHNNIIETINKDINVNYYKNLNNKVFTKEFISSSWVTINNNSDFNMPHTHEGSWLSGVFYIKLPDNYKQAGDILFQDPIQQRKHEIWYHKMENGNGRSFTPELGRLVLFPSWLWHQVTGNNTNQDRISFSFNIEYLPPYELNTYTGKKGEYT
tara:strand:+ start:803 stop:1459 length:657 start_codon:yes stop_codon:yes gene_type:complete